MVQLLSLPVVVWLMLEAGAGVITMVAPLLVFAMYRLWVLVDGWRAAMRRPRPLWSGLRRWGLLVVATACVWLIMEIELAAVHAQLARAAKIPSHAMEPTILRGDYLLLIPLSADEVRHGTLAVWNDDTRGEFLYRVVGLPGDTLQMSGSTFWRNGRKVSEPYARYDQTEERMSDEVRRVRYWGPLIVPRDSVFLLGDNRDSSADSRYVGFAPLEQLVAQPRRVYLSRDPATGEFRWARIGTVFRQPSSPPA
jgi:signal peptidase I